MYPRIVSLPEKKLIGRSLKMSFIQNRTAELWRSFMPDRNKIKNRLTADFYSLQIFDKPFEHKKFNPNTEFVRWAAMEVSDFRDIPSNMQSYTLKGGLYAVFIHTGLPSDFKKTFDFIYNVWLPQSEFELDKREHFELLGDKYKNDDPNSEEEIWIPLKLK